MKSPIRFVLPVIVVSQFLCTSLWFAGNAVLADLAQALHLEAHFLAHLTSAVQFGFIAGTLVFAVLAMADRYSPSRVFFLSSILAALFNLGITLEGIHGTEILLFRFLTGFFLAGIYPVGMKIASDYYQEGLGRSMGFLVGALVIGTALPHLLRDVVTGLPWAYVIYGTSLLSLAGGMLIFLFIPDGPFRRTSSQLKLSGFLRGFRIPGFRSAALGYFGHMWEVYTFWAFVPFMLARYNTAYPDAHLNVAWLSFLVIASGGPACVAGGLLAPYFGTARTATVFLCISCMCCILSPFFLLHASTGLFMLFLFFWSITVVPDSPLFSTLVAQRAPVESRGSSLTIVTSIGFSITILSMQVISLLANTLGAQYVYMFMAIGPVLGLIGLLTNTKHDK